MENRTLMDLSLRREWLRRIDPIDLNPILLPPCEVDVLIVADGTISFDEQDFGLQAFVETLLQPPGPYVKFSITLAHRSSFAQVSSQLQNHSSVNVITDFDFANASHFGTNKYDQVWLFGINAGGGPSDPELRAISEFMDGGGGLFATGDHGSLGKGLSSEVPRARSMRIWDNSSGEVGMTDTRRNDTNRAGTNMGSDFDDQSDDVPQPIEPKMYQTWQGIWQVSYPHPLLCGPDGVIRVMPDHPHEGECVVPSNTSQSYTFDGYTITEYPAASGVGGKPTPEVISRSSVPAGNTADSKDPTDAQDFGGIAAYDGHRANVGRVVTDATWHHFLNINLVGDNGNPSAAKRRGFLNSATGQDHLDDIKAYYRNIAVWISRPGQIRCFNRRTIWDLLWNHRVIEAVSTRPDVTFEMADARYVFDVGRHARDVLGNYASQCQAQQLAIDLVRPRLDEDLLHELDPWRPSLDPRERHEALPWTNPEPILDLALGGALVALREEFPEPDPEVREEAVEVFDDVVDRGVTAALEMARENRDKSLERSIGRWEGADN